MSYIFYEKYSSHDKSSYDTNFREYSGIIWDKSGFNDYNFMGLLFYEVKMHPIGEIYIRSTKNYSTAVLNL